MDQMDSLAYLVKALDSAYWELGEGLKGLSDGDVWKRPEPRLLSVGELVAHVSYWEAMSFLREEPGGPLADGAARYYNVTRDEPYSPDLGVEALVTEAKKIHELCMGAIGASNLSFDDKNPLRDGWTWGYTLIYQAFHLSYHAGQIYSVRHLMGHQTVDN